MKMMHLGVVILSLLLITLITLDTLRNVSFLADTTYLKVQFWCCLFFMADVCVEMLISDKPSVLSACFGALSEHIALF